MVTSLDYYIENQNKIQVANFDVMSSPETSQFEIINLLFRIWIFNIGLNNEYDVFQMHFYF